MSRELLINQLEAMFRSAYFAPAQEQSDRADKLWELGKLWALLKCGCECEVQDLPLVKVYYRGFDWFELGDDNSNKSTLKIQLPRNLPRPVEFAPQNSDLDQVFPRSRLLNICQAAIVPEQKWRNRDSGLAQLQLGGTYAMLQAGFTYQINREGGEWESRVTDAKTIWLDILHPAESGPEVYDTIYLPTEQRMQDKAGRDWY